MTLSWRPLLYGLMTVLLVATGLSPAAPVAAGSLPSLYTLDGYGGVHAVNGAPGLSGSTYWQGWDFARSLAVFADSSGGYVLDAYGGLHPVGSAPAINPAPAYWNDWDIARAVVLLPGSSAQSPAGYVLDGYGGLHAFGGAAPVDATRWGFYWGWDIARGVALAPWATANNPAGYVLDGYGGLHAFGSAPGIAARAYWRGWDIARSLVLLPGSTAASLGGYVLDGWGGVHGFGTQRDDFAAPGAYWPGWDIARSIVLMPASTPSSVAGYVLEGYGGYHGFGGAPALSAFPYWNWDIARGSAGAGTSSARGAHSAWNLPWPWQRNPTFFGLNGSGVNGPGADPYITSAAGAAGLHSVRVEFQWTQLEMQPGQWTWNYADQTASDLSHAGFDILGLLDYNNPIYGGGVHDFPPNFSAWLGYVNQVVGRYHQSVHSWEVWNEPNTAQFMTTGVNACQYASMLNQTSAAIKQIDPTATVVSGGVGGVDIPYLRSMLSCGGRADAYGMHPYSASAPDQNMLQYMQTLTLPYWFTEFGWNSQRVGEEAQASWLQQAFADWASLGDVERAYVYNYQDQGGSYFGILRADGSAKPAVAALNAIPKG